MQDPEAWHRRSHIRVDTRFLTQRTIQVRVGSSFSSVQDLQDGTQQGSVITPLLFLLLISGIPPSTNGVKLSVFADDSAIWKSGVNLDGINEDVQSYLKNVAEFFTMLGLRLSMTKTVAVLFTRRNDDPDSESYSFVGRRSKSKELQSSLNVIFDDKLSTAAHIEYVVNRSKSRLDLLKVISGAS